MTPSGLGPGRLQATTEAQSPKSPTVIARAVPQPSLLKNFKILLFRLFVDAIRVLIWIILSNKNEKDDSFSRLLYFERNLLLKKGSNILITSHTMLHFHLLQLNMWILPLKTFATAVFSITRGFLTQPGNRRQKFLATGPHSPDKNWRFPGPTTYGVIWSLASWSQTAEARSW